ncbi:MAG: 4Fe-4S dicluster domain-containing protein [Actinobacteria bacterium]|nr:4Fe-4S dicluster domain-containing protein [Actinomycetota bacterium]
MRFIAEDAIPRLLEHLAGGGRTVWAPRVVRDSVNTVLFAPWSAGEPVETGAYTHLSAKAALLPPTERLFGFGYLQAAGEERIELEPEEPEESPVLFGARVCDARALAALDALFFPASGGFNDPGYAGRRSGLTVITLACTTCDSACFCSSFGKGPAETDGSDLILYPVANGFLAEPVTDAGSELVRLDLFQDSRLEKPELAVTARVETAGLREKFIDLFSDIDLWRQVSEKCLSCGFCAYACPACHCFNIFDEMSGDREGERCRSWDSCMFYSYTLETSGHNPRPEIAHRYRNRIGHKFSYFPANRGEILCTGCGRCIRGCPAGVDIREVIRTVQER